MTDVNIESILSVAMLTPMDDPSSTTCRWGAPICFWGPPGIGKSGRVETAGESVGLEVETLYLSTLQPEDLSGIPMPTADGGVTRVCDLPQIQRLIELKKGVLFLDELTTARPAVQGAGLGVVYNRRVAGKRLPGRVRVIAAANPPEEAAGGWNLAPPMANRLLHVEVRVPTVDEWVSWLLGNSREEFVPMEQGEAIVTQNWQKFWPWTCGLGAGFMRRMNDQKKLYNMPKSGDTNRSRAWPSPRAWEAALRCIATSHALGMSELSGDLLKASCGDGLAVEWAEWVKYANLPDPKEVLDNGWRADKRRLDLAYAVYSSAIAFALGKTDKAEQRAYVIKAWGLLATAVQDKLADLALSPAQALLRSGYNTKSADADVMTAARPVMAHFGTTGTAAYVKKV